MMGGMIAFLAESELSGNHGYRVNTKLPLSAR
jgi:hypothetical protein